MAGKFKVGDYVTWDSEAGRVYGTITGVHKSPFKVNGYTHHASLKDPQYTIKSNISDHIAHHKASALRKVNHLKS